VSPAKTAKPIKMPFVMWTRVGPRNHVLDGGPDPSREVEISRANRTQASINSRIKMIMIFSPKIIIIFI